jgi:hypothetical protein
MRVHVWVPLALGVWATSLCLGCDAKIAARDPEAVRRYDERADAARTPWVFPSPDDPPGETTRPGSLPPTRPTVATSGQTPLPNTTADAATPEPSSTPTPEPTAQPVGTPTLTSVLEVTPPEPKTYRIGDDVTALVRFDKAVVWTGVPLLEYREGTTTFAFEPILGLGSDSHVFRYTVKPGDVASALVLNSSFNLSDGTFQERNGGEVVNALPVATPTAPLTGVTFDGRQEKAVSVTLPANGTYVDHFDVLVEFPNAVTLKGSPFLEILVDTKPPSSTGTLKRAPAIKAEGNLVTFRYVVEADDEDLSDGVTFLRSLQPGSQNSTLDVVLGANGNPVADSLAEASFTGGSLVKVGKELPTSTLYAHFRAEQGRLFAAPDANAAGCNASTALAWGSNAPVGCWQDTSGRAPFLVSEGPTTGLSSTTPDKRPLLESPASAPFPTAALAFPSSGLQPDGERHLRFPNQGAPFLTTGAPRFVALAFQNKATGNDVPLLWLDATRGVFLSPTDSLVRFLSDAKSGTATATLPLGEIVILGLADDGTRSALLQWSGGRAVRRSVSVVPSGAADSVFGWTLESLRLGGRLASGTTAFEGAVAEFLVYGNLTDTEQSRVLCTLAKRHLLQTGSCFD